MRSIFFIVATTLLVSACTTPGSTPTVQEPIKYPSTQSGSPAATYCTQQWGQISYEKNPANTTMDLIYCTTPGGEKMDAWKYMDEATTQSGAVQEGATQTGEIQTEPTQPEDIQQ